MQAISLYLQSSSLSLGELHQSMRTKALLGRISSFLNGRSRRLLDLTTEVAGRSIHGQHFIGYRTVPIQQIKGSESRLGDFDCDFNPIQTHTMERWVSVAAAHSSGVTLPAVELIQLGETYFVRDGHHRISVAHAFREEYIDAKVTVLELEPVSSPLPMLIVV